MKTAHQFRNMRIRNRVAEEINQSKGFEIEWLTPYQCRVNGMLDLYPTGRKYHNLMTGMRGIFVDVAACIKKQTEPTTL